MTDRLVMWLQQINRAQHPNTTPRPGALQRLLQPVDNNNDQRHGQTTFSQLHPAPQRATTPTTQTRKTRNGYETRS